MDLSGITAYARLRWMKPEIISAGTATTVQAGWREGKTCTHKGKGGENGNQRDSEKAGMEQPKLW